MNDRNAISVTSRERLRLEIASQTDRFLQEGGHIEQIRVGQTDVTRPIGPVWWDARTSSPLLM
ncbi:MAG: hypothetical protein JWM78_3233 [Verrucomicrobiaceae bacterium]|nr:hypothetical protein [Verrucomicrobiaceae bacterium]